jgi:hypothetical protein
MLSKACCFVNFNFRVIVSFNVDGKHLHWQIDVSSTD